MQTNVIEVKGRQSIALPKLVKALEEAIKDGWSTPEEFLHNDCRMFSQNWFRVVLFKEAEVDELEIKFTGGALGGGMSDLTGGTVATSEEPDTEGKSGDINPLDEITVEVDISDEMIDSALTELGLEGAESGPDFEDGPEFEGYEERAEGDSEVTPEEAVVEKDGLKILEGLTKKVELLAFAKESGIVVPENIKQPAAIAKHLRKQLTLGAL